MPWVLLDIVIGALAVLLFGGLLYAGYRHVRQLMSTAKTAGSRIGALTAEIDAIQSGSAGRRTP